MMGFIIILFGKGGLDYLLGMRPGKVMIEMSGMNPASDLLSGEQLVNQERLARIDIDIKSYKQWVRRFS